MASIKAGRFALPVASLETYAVIIFRVHTTFGGGL